MTILRKVFLPTLTNTTQEAKRLASFLHPGDLLLLQGELGVGKTAFARAILRTLSADDALVVPSPTFNLIQIFETGCGPVWHVDLYRLRSPEEWAELGLEEAFLSAICLVEWPDHLNTFWKSQGLELRFSMDHHTGNRTLIYSGEKEWARRFEAMVFSP